MHILSLASVVDDMSGTSVVIAVVWTATTVE